MGRVISTAITFVDGFSKPSADVIKNMSRMANNIKQQANQIRRAGKAISSVGSSLTKTVTTPIVGVATAAIKTAADFEAAMSEVGAISGASETALTKLTKKAEEMGATTSFSATESAEAMKYMAMAGWKTKDMLNGIEGVMNLAAASGEDLATTSDIVTDGLTAFGMSAKESTRFADVMAATSTNANTNVALMGETFKYCASTAGAMGYSIEDVSVAIGIMGNAGIKGSTAGTTLKNMIANMAKPTDAQAAAMEKLGLSLTDSSGNMKSFSEVMTNLRSSFSGLSKTEKAAYATTLAGKESMAGLLTIVNASSKDFKKLTKAINGSGGSADEMAKKMLANLKGQLTLLKSAVEGVAIKIGNKFLPTLTKLTEKAQDVFEWLNNLSDAQWNNILKWAGIAAAIPPIIMVFGKVVTMIGTVKKTWGTAIQLFAKFGGVAGLIKSPAGVVIGTLGAIAIAAFLIIKNWKQVKGFLKNVGSWFQNVFEEAGFSVEDFTDKFSAISNTVGNITGKITGFVKKIAKIFKKEFAGGISEGAAEASGTLETIAGGAITAFHEIITVVDKSLQAFDAFLEFFGGAFTGNWNDAAQGFRNSIKKIFPSDMAADLIKKFDNLLPTIKAVVSGVKATFKELIKDIKKIFGEFPTIFKGAGTMLKGIFSSDAETALEGFQTAAGGILDTVGNIFKAKLNTIKNFVVGAFSTFLPESTVNKIAGAFDDVAFAWDIAIGAAKDCVKDFVQAIKPLIENIKTIFKGVAQFIKGVFTGDWKGALNGLKTIASGALSGLEKIIKAPFKAISKAPKEAINSFKKFGTVKSIFNAVGKVIKKVLSKAGVNLKTFSANVKNIKARISNILKNLKTIFSTVFGAIGNIVKKVMKLIVPVVKVAFSTIKSIIAAGANSIADIISGILTVFDGLITFITGVFTCDWRKAWEGVKTIFKGVFDSLVALCKTPINAVIGIINGAIAGINSLKVSIPDWVPGLGGKSFGVNLPTIPMLYKGTDNWQGGTAIIHDRGGEIVDLPKGTRVYPHDKSIEMARHDGASQGKSGNMTINIQKLADKIEVRSDEDIDRIAEALALKLKKVAFNMA